MKRVFIAINLPEEVKTEFKRIQAILKQQNKDVKVTWVDPIIAHLILYFLGDLDEVVVNDLKEHLAALEGKFGPISLVLTGVGAFPSQNFPRVLFLGVKQAGNNYLVELYHKIGKILSELKLFKEERPFIAHITLGRIKNGNRKIKIMGEEMPDIKFTINSFELMESVLRPEGPEYKIIKSYDL